MKEAENIWTKLSPEEFNYHLKQFLKPYRSNVYAIEFLKSNIEIANKSMKVLDLGCGSGANIFWMNKSFPHCLYLGVDLNPELIRIGEEKLNLKNVVFKASNFFEITDKADLVCSFQILSWLEYNLIPRFLELNFKLSNKYVFLTSLFNEDNLNIEINVNDFCIDKKVYYHHISLDWLEKFSNDSNFRIKKAQKFDIDIDLEKNIKGRGTYTVKTIDGKRLQFSSTIFMPWYFVLLEKK